MAKRHLVYEPGQAPKKLQPARMQPRKLERLQALQGPSGTPRSLDDIAASIRRNCEKGAEAASVAFEAALAIGSDLLDARKLFASDKLYGQWFAKQKFPFKQKWAWILMEASKHEPEIRATQLSQLSKGNEFNFEKAVTAIRNGALYSSESDEWWSPSEVLSRAVSVLGAIDLDPCSNSAKSVPASTHYTEQEDGLAQQWSGTVYMNPPYGREIEPWIQKLCDEFSAGQVSEAIALVPARLDTAWFALLADFPVCFVSGRLKFVNSFGSDNPAPFPSAVVYLGKDIRRFHAAFSELGRIWVQWRPDFLLQHEAQFDNISRRAS